MRRSILEEFPDAHVVASIVWIHMLSDDTKAAAGSSARILNDPRVRHFHDPNQWAGRAIARSLGLEGEVAWDVYLFYDMDSEWREGPPAPVACTHQLKWLELEHFRTGDDLVKELLNAMRKMLGKTTG